MFCSLPSFLPPSSHPLTISLVSFYLFVSLSPGLTFLSFMEKCPTFVFL